MTKELQQSTGEYVLMMDEVFEKLKQLAATKGAEYAHGDNRLDNFVRNAKDLDLEPEVVWRVYAAKHWDAITTYVKDIIVGNNRVRSESIEGRIDDLMVYLLLLRGMVAARAPTILAPQAPVTKAPPTTPPGGPYPLASAFTNEIPISKELQDL